GAVHLVDGAQADAHAADRTGTRRFHSRRDAALRAGACMGRAAIRGGEQWPNPRMPREEGSLRISRGSGALRQLALFSDPGAAALPGGDPQRAAQAGDHSPFASGEWLLGVSAENRAVGADTGRRADPV